MALWGSGVQIPSAPPNSSSVRRPLFSGWAVSMQCEFGIPHSSQNKKLRSRKIPKAKSPRNREKRKIANREPMLTPLAPRSNLTAPSPLTRHSQFQIHNSKTPLSNSLENKIEKKAISGHKSQVVECACPPVAQAAQGNKTQGKEGEDEGVFFRFWDDLAVDDNAHRTTAACHKIAIQETISVVIEGSRKEIADGFVDDAGADPSRRIPAGIGQSAPRDTNPYIIRVSAIFIQI